MFQSAKNPETDMQDAPLWFLSRIKECRQKFTYFTYLPKRASTHHSHPKIKQEAQWLYRWAE